MNKDHLGYLLATLTAMIYGVSFIFTKSASATFSALQIPGWRFTLAFFTLFILYKLGVVKMHFSREALGHFIPLVILFPMSFYIINTYAIKLTSASESGIILATIPLVTVLLNDIINKEKPYKEQILGILLTFIGIGSSLIGGAFSPTFSPLGYLLLLIAVLSFSAYGVIIYNEKILGSLEKTYIVIGICALFYTLFGLTEGLLQGSFLNYVRVLKESAFLPALFYLGLLATVIAFFMNISAIDILGVARNSVFECVSTLTSMIAGLIILKEPHTLFKLLTTAFIIIGIIIASSRGYRKGRL